MKAATPSWLAVAVLLPGCASRWEMHVEPAAGRDPLGEIATIPARVTVQTAHAPGSDRSWNVVPSGDLSLDFAQSLVKHRVFESVQLADVFEAEGDTMLRVDQRVEEDRSLSRGVLEVLTLGIIGQLFETREAIIARGEVTLRRSGEDVRRWNARSVVRVTYKGVGWTREREDEATWAAVEALHLDLIGQIRRDRALFSEGSDRQAMSANARPPPGRRP